MESRYDSCVNVEHTRNRLLSSCEQLKATKEDPVAEPCGDTAVGVKGHAETDTSTWQVTTESGVKFCDVTGATQALQSIWESLIIPIKYPSIFRQVKASPWKAVLLYGPPGTGKSMIARATAGESSANFYSASCADLTSKWVGGSEKLMHSLFNHARDNSPAIIFFDEIDSVAGVRDSQKSIADQRLTNQLLIELDACSQRDSSKSVFVIAATNLPWQIDMAVMRRFPKRVYIALPGPTERETMLIRALAGIVSLSVEEVEQLVVSTDGFSGADIANIVNDVALEPLRMLMDSKDFIVGGADPQSVEGLFPTSPCVVAPAYLLSNTTFQEAITQFPEEVFRVPNVSFAMVTACVCAASASVDVAAVKKYQEYVFGR